MATSISVDTGIIIIITGDHTFVHADVTDALFAHKAVMCALIPIIWIMNHAERFCTSG
jgi:hypothetical protein